MVVASKRGCVYTLIAAPAGAGKTMLMAQRMAQLRAAQTPAAWVSLDGADNDATVFWAGVLASCARAVSVDDTEAGATFATRRPPPQSGDRGFFAAVFALIERLPRGLHLILDDVHELESDDMVADLRRLLRNAPPQLHITFGCRYDPPLPFPRLVVEGRAWEIRADRLAFDRDEARELLASHGVELSEVDLNLLLTRTEGWAAGLRLAAMSLRSRADQSSYVASFAGDDRPVMDYLMSEVLANYPPDTVSLLLATAVPTVVSAGLAAELSGRADAGSILDGLSRENALIHRENTTPASYRYHPLLRGFLLAELGRRDARATREIHLVAADWFTAQGSTMTALGHAADAHDWNRVADILDQDGLGLLMTGRTTGLAGVLDRLPLPMFGRPTISLIAALAALQDGRFGVAASHIDRVGRDPSVFPEARTRLLHAATLMYEARISGVRGPEVIAPLVEAADTTGYLDNPMFNLLATANRGMLLMLTGNFTAADNDLRSALRMARQAGWDYLAFDCLTHLAGNAAGLNDYGKLAAWSREAIEFAHERGWTTSSRLPQAYLAAAWSSWQMMDSASAAEYVALASAIEADIEPEARTALQVIGLIIEFVDAANPRATLNTLRSVWAEASPDVLNTAMVCAFSLAEVNMALSIAEPVWAAEAAQRTERAAGRTGDVLVQRAWIHLFNARQEAARQALGPVLSDDVDCLVVSSEITAWLLEAHMAAANGENAKLYDAMLRAVALAAPRRAVRDVANASTLVRTRLAANLGRFGGHDEFVAEVVERTRSATVGSGTVAGEAITPRELELLRDLPSMLSLDDIAQAHVVSINTVKTHLKALYRKLAVNNRRDAVTRARELGLI